MLPVDRSQAGELAGVAHVVSADALTETPPLLMPWRWTVVLPVKGGPWAKTRLAALGSLRPAIAAALASDSVAAAASCSRVAAVVVVTGDRLVAAGVAEGAASTRVVADPGSGLDAAIRAGLADADARMACAVLLADVPAMRPVDLAAGLDRCARALALGAASAVVPDLDGDGTVLLAATHPGGISPSFGKGSAARHAAAAAVVTDAPDRLRRDVDHPEHLADALAMGVGPATAAVTTGIRRWAPA